MLEYKIEAEILSGKDLHSLFKSGPYPAEYETKIKANNQEELLVKLESYARKVCSREEEELEDRIGGNTTYGYCYYKVANHHRKSMVRTILFGYRGGGCCHENEVLRLTAVRV